ncbi:FkbM family methyltransferase, partial [Clostridium sporogenes]|uniref:FkbM family methyltransferase n=1 Tax=Clostridium sporogenes TaxID=1509 RepID=UPI0013D5E764
MIIESLSEVFEENIKKKVIKKDVIIYGTGTIAKEVYEVLINSKYNVNCFINMNLNYTNEVKGLAKIKRADDNKITSELKEKTTIIISIFNSYADVHTIISQLKKLGFKNIICFTELIDIFENKFKERFYLNKKIDLFKDKEKILHIENIWNDEKSKQLYNSIVKFRLYKDYKYLLAKDSLEEQYLPKDIKKLYNQQNIRFIDCGAFDGDTIKNFLNENKKIDSIIAFEPDMGNYKNLISSIREIKLEHKHSRISAFPCAVYSDTAHLKCNMEGSPGSNISDCGLNIVQCVSIV